VEESEGSIGERKYGEGSEDSADMMDDMCDFRGIVARMVTCAFGLDMEQCWMRRCFECCSSSSSSSDCYTD
jgi:hypothetical protein